MHEHVLLCHCVDVTADVVLSTLKVWDYNLNRIFFKYEKRWNSYLNIFFQSFNCLFATYFITFSSVWQTYHTENLKGLIFLWCEQELESTTLPLQHPTIGNNGLSKLMSHENYLLFAFRVLIRTPWRSAQKEVNHSVIRLQYRQWHVAQEWSTVPFSDVHHASFISKCKENFFSTLHLWPLTYWQNTLIYI